MVKPQLKTTASYDECFADQERLVDREGEKAVAAIRPFVAGGGGLGFPVAVAAARAGIQTIYQADAQRVEPENRNRIYAAGRHRGIYKLHVLQEFFEKFDRSSDDEGFRYVPLVYPVEHPEVQLALRHSTHIIACQNSAESRLWLVRFARDHQKVLFNVGFACEPGRFMGGEISIYRPARPDLACPACISLKAGVKASDTLFFPPLAMLAALVVQLLIAEVTGFDMYGPERPNYIVFDGFRYSLSACLVPADPDCKICRR